MDVLDGIERGEIGISVHLPGGWNLTDDKQRIKRIDDMEAVRNELLHLAKLGAAAEKAMSEVDGTQESLPCSTFHQKQWRGEHGDCDACNWQQVCREVKP
jgi:hypothetical protein